MTQKPDGGRAFPAGTHKVYDEDGFMLGSGMSLRDYFAGQALAGLGLEDGDAYVALRAYQIADAMIAARDAE